MARRARERPAWVKIRATSEQRARWQAVAAAKGVSLSELVRQGLDGLRARPRRHQPRAVDPELVRELARVGNNLNQLARWANREKGGVEAVAVVARLIELDRELGALRRAHEAPVLHEGAPAEAADGLPAPPATATAPAPAPEGGAC